MKLKLFLFAVLCFVLLLSIGGCAADRSLCKTRQPNPTTKEGMAAQLQEETEDMQREINPNSVPPRKYFCAGYTVQE